MKKIFILSLLSVMVLSACSNAADTTAAKAKKAKAVKTTLKTVKTTSDSVKIKPAKPPKLVDLGANKCIPCKMMAPILDQLGKDYQGKLEVVVLDVWQNPDEGNKYRIRVIPTQIFFSPEGKELYRHEGFYSREDILKKWKELGYDFNTDPVKEK